MPSAGGVSPSTPLARFEPEDRDMTANRFCFPAIVALTGVDLLRKPINTCVVVGVGDLSRQKFLADQFAFRGRRWVRTGCWPRPCLTRFDQAAADRITA